MLTRREFLGVGAAAGAAACLTPVRTGPQEPALALDPLDEAFERFQAFAPTYGGGASNHGPMAVEALAAMGLSSAIAGWARSYERRLDPAPRAREPIAAGGWQEARGRAERHADWEDLFERAIAEDGADATLRTWLPQFAHDPGCYAFHGAIRAGHAARALRARDTAPRRRELATALAFWASRCGPTPEPQDAAGAPAAADLPLADCIAQIESAVPDTDRPGGSVMAGIQRVIVGPNFRAAAARADLSGPPDATLDRVGLLFAERYLRHGHASRIGFIHAVTGPVGVRRLLPWLDEGGAAVALRATWTAAAAIHAAFRTAPREPAATPPPDRARAAAAALANGDEHAIKFAEALLDLDARAPDPLLLRAAADAAAAL